MTRKLSPLVVAALLVLSLGVGTIPAGAQAVGTPFVRIDAAPEGAAVAVDEHFDGSEMSNTPPLAAGAVGPLPVFVADDEYGCIWATAIASGAQGWIGVARRGLTDAEGTDRCAGFQSKVTTATAAGADALIIVNHSAGHEPGTAAGEIPSLMIDGGAGDRLIDSLDAAAPEAVQVTLASLDPNSLLPPEPVEPTLVPSLEAAADAGTLTVTGRAFFGGQAPAVVGQDPAGDVPFPPQLGLDIVEARIGQPNSATGDLAFELDLTDLPASGGVPEHVRYNWDFAVDTGTGVPKPFQIDGKLTDVVRRNSTNVPAFFLRGNCATVDNVITCEDVAELATTMDGAFDRITVTVPKEVLEADIGSSLEGATIGPADICEGISTKIAANFTLCGGVGQNTGDIAVQDPDLGVYEMASRSMEVGIVPAGAPAEFRDQATIGSGDTFSATLDVSGLSPGTYDVHARACYGSNCATESTTVTI